jgi:hypothetical protein
MDKEEMTTRIAIDKVTVWYDGYGLVSWSWSQEFRDLSVCYAWGAERLLQLC